ncbi:hypothetical protein NW762_010514 [Fusarium torreyae]|uniref:Xylanolytic transcriptional activator regulatory domain-containing protein n=1 Tax=Fusarium torreyae TaxID=1237075 RepID=A0A9W8VA85_9HYPO|nr:hypothetical protein NW762_010514 [Fusarium torreyae]
MLPDAQHYVPGLERRIAYLESKLRENCIDDVDGESPQESMAAQSALSVPSDLEFGRTPSDTNTTDQTEGNINLNPDSDVRELVDTVVGLSRNRPGYDLSFPQVLLTELMHSARPGSVSQDRTEVPGTVGDMQITPSIASDLDTSAVTLPTEDTAQSLVNAYFQFADVAMPLLHQPSFRQQLDLVYSMPRTINFTETHIDTNSRTAVFFVLEVFAIALLSMQKQDPSRVSPWLADRYHKTALSALNKASLPGGVEGIQALLLIAQYSYHHPAFWAAWRTVGAALRLAVELGLHQDTTSGLDPLVLDTRRRTFWVAYSMDRNLSVAMSMPFGLSDGAISAEFPSDVADHFITLNGIETTAVSVPKQIALQMFRYRQIQSELRLMLWEPPHPYAPVNLAEWQNHMRKRIDNWYNSMPPGNNLGTWEKGVLNNFETTRNTALFNLYRPSPNNPTPSEEQAVAMAEVATNMIHLYQRLFREKRLSIYWQSIENVFSAGTALMLAYSRSPGVQEAITLSSLESLIHTCSSLLWGMVERFPALQGKRDAFDITASKVLEGLKAGPLENGDLSFLNIAGDFTAPEQTSDVFPDRDNSLATCNILPAETQQQSWFDFLAPDDFTFHSNQEPLLFQDLDIWNLVGNDPMPENDAGS